MRFPKEKVRNNFVVVVVVVVVVTRIAPQVRARPLS